jgi:hypothetical protein
MITDYVPYTRKLPNNRVFVLYPESCDKAEKRERRKRREEEENDMQI